MRIKVEIDTDNVEEARQALQKASFILEDAHERAAAAATAGEVSNDRYDLSKNLYNAYGSGPSIGTICMQGFYSKISEEQARVLALPCIVSTADIIRHIVSWWSDAAKSMAASEIARAVARQDACAQDQWADKIRAFGDKLTELLTRGPDSKTHRYKCTEWPSRYTLTVDYEPQGLLARAAEVAGMGIFPLPFKISMHVTDVAVYVVQDSAPRSALILFTKADHDWVAYGDVHHLWRTGLLHTAV